MSMSICLYVYVYYRKLTRQTAKAVTSRITPQRSRVHVRSILGRLKYTQNSYRVWYLVFSISPLLSRLLVSMGKKT